ncbi:MAG: hypothetical protein ACLQVX_23245 [Limisphaerales bacterium]
MSRGAIEQVLSELQCLPESDQEVVLGFLRALKRQHRSPKAPALRRGHNPALQIIDGLLVFTGELEGPQTDWVRVVREERDAEILRQEQGNTGAR